MFSSATTRTSRRRSRDFYEAEKPTAALLPRDCGAASTCGSSDGAYLVAGKTVTGFANVEEDFGDAAVGRQIMPWRVEDVLRERGANYIRPACSRRSRCATGELITGQQQYSGRKVAQIVIETLGVEAMWIASSGRDASAATRRAARRRGPRGHAVSFSRDPKKLARSRRELGVRAAGAGRRPSPAPRSWCSPCRGARSTRRSPRPARSTGKVVDRHHQPVRARARSRTGRARPPPRSTPRGCRARATRSRSTR